MEYGVDKSGRGCTGVGVGVGSLRRVAMSSEELRGLFLFDFIGLVSF